MTNEWYIERENGTAGPFTGSQLKELAASGRLRPDDRVRRGHDGKAASASRVKGLFSPDAAAHRPTLLPVPEPASKAWTEHPAILVPLLLICFPVGLFFVWRSARLSTVQKWRWSGAFAAVLLALGLLGQLQLTPTPQIALGETGQSRVTSQTPNRSSAVEHADASAGTRADLPDFSQVDYTFDFSKEDYSSIPPGAERHVKEERVSGSGGEFEGKLETNEGYRNADGQFVAHGKFVTWYDDAKTKKMREGWAKHGKTHGVVTFYFEDGNKAGERPYVDGERHGVHRMFHKNGQIVFEHPYIHGNEHGVFRGWHEDGKPSYEKLFVNGQKGYTESGMPAVSG